MNNDPLIGLLKRATTQGVPTHAAILEMAEIVSSDPLIIRHRGVDSSVGVVAVAGLSPTVGLRCLVAVFAGRDSQTSGLRIVTAMIAN